MAEKKVETKKVYPVYSELLKKPFDTVEELEKAEAELKAKLEKKAETKVVPTERQVAADKVTKAFQELAELKSKVQESYNEIDAKKKEDLDEIDTQIQQLQIKANAISRDYTKQERELEGQVLAKEKEVRTILNEFCNKFGSYHYTCAGTNDNIYPLFEDMMQSNAFINPFFDYFFRKFF